ncbi:carbohydrate ABC transporter permease [Ruminiclostridium cellobioparum]|uniref:ABC-type sugar transport system, permease component n=1 Tax=Ruminiclostridium cellobioparum subsp. termitidis CT1112 TaxID=1195236 RepID=S0FKF5_RUMCE|nr:sugar ABC transporter permease [Ruminiclostridium cellobioparum]EMS69003.1 ABC-type sugar transport system, permease component [Ruminiclostridium cellobioparum subsp. termitidis CT1112]
MKIIKTFRKLQREDTFAGFLFLLPSLCGVLLFFIIPFIGGLYYAVVDSPINGHFVGLKNFINLLHNDAFLKASANTSLFTMLCVPLNICISLILALMLNNRFIKNSNRFRMLFIAPLVIPVASVAFFWQLIFDNNGTLNYFLYRLGATTVDWMKTDWSRTIIIIIYLWKNVGYNVVLYLSALSNIPIEYYESADIDGAPGYQKFFNITFIYLTPSSFFVFIISIINSFKVFRETYLIAGQYPHENIYFLQHYMNNIFISLDYQKLTSAAYMMAAAITILVFILFNYQKKISTHFTQ